MNTKKQTIEHHHNGYVLYDHDLDLERLKQSINNTIALHDVFQLSIQKQHYKLAKYEYIFDVIDTFDQITFVEDLDTFFNKSYVTPALFKMIYFNGHLRGYTYQLKSIYFDYSSVQKVVISIEKGYLKGKNKALGSSYYKWLINENKSFEHYFNKHIERRKKSLLLDTVTSKEINTYCKENEINIFQCITGVIASYFKIHHQEDFVFQTDYFNESKSSVIGNLEPPFSYQLNFKSGEPLNQVLKSDYKQLDVHSDYWVHFDGEPVRLKGDLYPYQSGNALCTLGFHIGYRNNCFLIDILYDKNKYKKDHIFLMVNKLKLMFSNLSVHEDQPFGSVELLTDKEIHNNLKFSEPSYESHTKSLYEMFIQTRLKYGEKIAYEDSEKSYSYIDLSSRVSKISKIMSKIVEPGDTICIKSQEPLERMIGLLAIDHCGCVLTDDMKSSKYHLLKTLLTYKLIKNACVGAVDAQYITHNQAISKLGYRNYCKWFFNYFKLTSDDRVLYQHDGLRTAIPALIQGTRVVNGSVNEMDEKHITLAELSLNEIKPYVTLKHGLVMDKVDQDMTYTMHRIFAAEGCVPIVLVGRNDFNKIKQAQVVDGIGMLILKNKKLTPANSSGNCYIFGPGMGLHKSNTEIKTHGLEIQESLKLDVKGSWTLEGDLRLHI